jgi:prepilin-type N-terminal cleavage/methylation domain-containing protein
MSSSKSSTTRQCPHVYKCGMTLIELAIALFVVALAFAGVFGMSNQVTRVMSQARGETRAMECAQSEVERLRCMSWAELTALGGGYSLTEQHNAALAGVPQGIGTATIAPFPAASTSVTVRSVSVAIQWEDAAGLVYTNHLATLIAEKGLNP